MSLRVRVVRSIITDQYEFFILERVDGRMSNILRPAADGNGWQRDPWGTGARDPRPSFAFNQDEAQDVLTSLAQQLAQLGFTQLVDAQPVVKAMQVHLDDLRAAAERTHDLAAHLVVGAITRKEP